MINVNSIAADTAEHDPPAVTGLSNMAVALTQLGGRAKNARTLQAALALGASSAHKAMQLARELQSYVDKHLPGTSYLVELRHGRTLRISAEGEHQHVSSDDLIFEKDISEL